MLESNPFRSRTFKHLAAAYSINELGTWIGDVALALLVFDRTASPLATAGLFLALRFLPSLVAPLLTTRIETFDASRVLPALYIGEAILYGGIAVLSRHFSLPGVLALAIADGVLAIAAKALTRSAAANDLIPRDLLREGNTLLNLAFIWASAIGPAVAGVVVAWKGPSWALALDALTFAAAALVVAATPDLHVASDPDTGAVGRLRAGVEVIRTEPGLLWLLVGFGIVLMVSSVAVPIEVVFAKETLHAGDRGYGVLLASWGVGMILGGSVYAGAARVSNIVLLAVSVALLAAGYGGLAAAPDLAVACAFSALGGVGNGIGGITAITAIQQAIPLTAQSAVMAVFEATNQAMPALGFVAGGVVTALTSPRAAYAVSAAGVAVVLLVGILVPGAEALMADTDHPRRQRTHLSTERNFQTGDIVAAGIHVAVLCAVVVVGVLTAHEANWDLSRLAIIIVLAVASELMAVWIADGTVYVSGSFLGIMLAAVLLGGAPAAIVGMATIAGGWLRSRESPSKLLHNLSTFGAFPLVSGLVFYALTNEYHIGPHRTVYYVYVLLTFWIGLLLNFTMVQIYAWYLTRASLLSRFKALKPIIAPELFTAMLMLAAAYVTNRLGAAALMLVAVVLVLFQYLVGELLQSQARGEELRVMATTDELTGFPNRKGFGDVLTATIAESTPETSFGVLLLDLDHFKDINDTLGHEYGDDLLAQLAPRLKAHSGDGAVLARLGGDEFALLPSARADQTHQLERCAVELRRCVQDPFTVGDVTMTVNASIGIARFPADGGDAQTLMRRADIALHDAKKHRDGHNFYDTDSDHHSARRLSLVGDFRAALKDEEQLMLNYHPIVDIASGQLHGAEALVRWRHPERGLLTPASFLRTVESTGLITQMTERVLDLAVADCLKWESIGLKLTVGVNLSVRDLLDSSLPQAVAETLVRHGLDAHRLKLEITESMIMSDPERALMTVRGLRALGVRLAVDDFGTGHASLANLRLLPVDELKIDRSFVTPMLKQKSDLVIVRSTIELGHALGLTVIAEGVEDEATLDELALMHCDRAQGHYFSQPIPAEPLARWAEAFGAGAQRRAATSPDGAPEPSL